jgi:hypothetical protein
VVLTILNLLFIFPRVNYVKNCFLFTPFTLDALATVTSEFVSYVC